MIRVKRESDGKIFTNDMTSQDCIYEIHFSTSYTQVKVQELQPCGTFKSSELICAPEKSKPSFVDMIAVQGYDKGEFIYSDTVGEIQ